MIFLTICKTNPAFCFISHAFQGSIGHNSCFIHLCLSLKSEFLIITYAFGTWHMKAEESLAGDNICPGQSGNNTYPSKCGFSS